MSRPPLGVADHPHRGSCLHQTKSPVAQLEAHQSTAGHCAVSYRPLTQILSTRRGEGRAGDMIINGLDSRPEHSKDVAEASLLWGCVLARH
jgi:hypothetical protein